MFNEKILEFYSTKLRGKSILKEKIIRDFDGLDWKLVNPYNDDEIWDRFKWFVETYYKSDQSQRNLIIALNPGRKGCSKTGIALTDEDILKNKLGYPGQILKPEREPNTAQRVYVVIEDVFHGDFHKFFSCYFLTNVFPFGVEDNQGNNMNDFLKLIKLPSVNGFSNGFIADSINLFEPERILCIGKESEKFITKNFPDKRHVPLPHPSDRRGFPEDKKERWRETLRKSCS